MAAVHDGAGQVREGVPTQTAPPYAGVELVHVRSNITAGSSHDNAQHCTMLHDIRGAHVDVAVLQCYQMVLSCSQCQTALVVESSTVSDDLSHLATSNE